ncbi:MAG: hypothetical protein KIPDCIKN_02724 [Haliscomenobacter sp.]|jgi:hypothetical protein|nr:hypothetical protein [Haliscomenobacter sp.]
MTSEINPPLTNLQMELLRIFSLQLPEEDLLEIRRVLTRFMMEKARERATFIAEERGYTEDTFKKWAHGDEE